MADFTYSRPPPQAERALAQAVGNPLGFIGGLFNRGRNQNPPQQEQQQQAPLQRDGSVRADGSSRTTPTTTSVNPDSAVSATTASFVIGQPLNKNVADLRTFFNGDTITRSGVSLDMGDESNRNLAMNGGTIRVMNFIPVQRQPVAGLREVNDALIADFGSREAVVGFLDEMSADLGPHGFGTVVSGLSNDVRTQLIQDLGDVYSDPARKAAFQSALPEHAATLRASMERGQHEQVSVFLRNPPAATSPVAASTAVPLSAMELAAIHGGVITLGGNGQATVTPNVAAGPTAAAAQITGAPLPDVGPATLAPAQAAVTPAAAIGMNLAQMGASLDGYANMSAAEQANLRGSYDSLSDADKTAFLNRAEGAGLNAANLVSGQGEVVRASVAVQLGEQLADLGDAATSAANFAEPVPVSDVSQSNAPAVEAASAELPEQNPTAPVSTPAM